MNCGTRSDYIYHYLRQLHLGNFEEVWGLRRHLISILTNHSEGYYSLSDVEEHLEIVETAIARYRSRNRRGGA